jgi:competence CoiA-like predicted nuclease
MLFAFTSEKIKIEPFPGGRAFCPGCESEVNAKCGSTNIWHWAHDSLEDCDNWKYEPKTKWHLHWQNRFHKDDIEKVIVKNKKFHIADIVGNNDVVIEIQNSPISAEEIIARELFYEKMIWILNGYQFAENIKIIGFPTSIEMDSLKAFINYEREYSSFPRKIKLNVPLDDDFAIETCLLANPDMYRQDEHEENVWYIDNPHSLNNFSLPSDLRSAYIAYALHEQFMAKIKDEEKSYPIHFEWLRKRRSWMQSTMPIFIDISYNFMILITEHRFGRHFQGKVITKQRFFAKYRKRMPN